LKLKRSEADARAAFKAALEASFKRRAGLRLLNSEC
jgi:hypothetical protein